MDTREGQLNIAVHGAEMFGLGIDSPELDDRNYRLVFLPYSTERRLSDFKSSTSELDGLAEQPPFKSSTVQTFNVL
jgi:hypothetical protein